MKSRLAARRGGRARLNAADSKSAVLERVPGVRIPPSPPYLFPGQSGTAKWPETRTYSVLRGILGVFLLLSVRRLLYLCMGVLTTFAVGFYHIDLLPSHHEKSAGQSWRSGGWAGFAGSFLAPQPLVEFWGWLARGVRMTTVCGEPQELEDEGSDPPTLPQSARKDGAPGVRMTNFSGDPQELEDEGTRSSHPSAKCAEGWGTRRGASG
jgi:hypothetical protein